MGSGFRQDQSLLETPLCPKLASSGDTDSGRGAGRTRPAGGRTGVHIGALPPTHPLPGAPLAPPRALCRPHGGRGKVPLVARSPPWPLLSLLLRCACALKA